MPVPVNSTKSPFLGRPLTDFLNLHLVKLISKYSYLVPKVCETLNLGLRSFLLQCAVS